MKKVTAVLLLLVILSFSGCSSLIRSIADKGRRSDPGQVTSSRSTVGAPDSSSNVEVISEDGKVSLIVPSSWEDITSVNENTSLTMGNHADELYVMVINESKDNFADGFTLKDYYNVICEQMDGKIEGAEWSSDYDLKVGDYPAIYTEVSGTISGVDLYYFIDVIETANSFDQVIGWTRVNKAEDYADTLTAIMDTFVEYE